MVRIVGLNIEDIDEDTFNIVFSNEDHGGGEIENINIHEDTVYITFAEATGTSMYMYFIINLFKLTDTAGMVGHVYVCVCVGKIL